MSIRPSFFFCFWSVFCSALLSLILPLLIILPPAVGCLSRIGWICPPLGSMTAPAGECSAYCCRLVHHTLSVRRMANHTTVLFILTIIIIFLIPLDPLLVVVNRQGSLRLWNPLALRECEHLCMHVCECVYVCVKVKSSGTSLVCISSLFAPSLTILRSVTVENIHTAKWIKLMFWWCCKACFTPHARSSYCFITLHVFWCITKLSRR